MSLFLAYRVAKCDNKVNTSCFHILKNIEVADAKGCHPESEFHNLLNKIIHKDYTFSNKIDIDIASAVSFEFNLLSTFN